MQNCNICIENFNKSTHQIIKCMCEYSCCKTCAKTYLLNLDTDPNCMNCQVKWTREFLHENFDKTFINKQYKQHREQLLYERELGTLQATQPLVEQEINSDKIKKELIVLKENYTKNIKPLNTQLVKHPDEKNYLNLLDSLKRFGDQKNFYTNPDLVKTPFIYMRVEQIQDRLLTTEQELKVAFPKYNLVKQNKEDVKLIKNQIKNLKQQYLSQKNILQLQLSPRDISENKREFIRKCPNNDCLGFLSTSLKCMLCNCWSCKDCREIKGFDTLERDTHICNTEILENIKLLKKDSKPCPKCASLTFKINGCNSMWCVECHSSWNWQTGIIEKGRIHNPHYYEWQRINNNGVIPRNPLDLLNCGREINQYFISQWRSRVMNTNDTNLDCDPQDWERLSIVKKQNKKRLKRQEQIYHICQRVIHTSLVSLPNFQNLDRLNENLQLRIDFMRKKITQEQFKTTIYKREKHLEKKREIHDVLMMYINSMTDILYRLRDSNNQDLTEINALKMYTNGCLNKISTIYNSKKYTFNEFFTFS